MLPIVVHFLDVGVHCITPLGGGRGDDADVPGAEKEADSRGGAAGEVVRASGPSDRSRGKGSGS